VCGVCAPLVLAQIAPFLVTSFLGDLDRSFITRSLVSLVTLVRRLLVGLCIGIFLGTYALNSLEKQEKQTHVQGSHTFFVKVELACQVSGYTLRMQLARSALANNMFMGIVDVVTLGLKYQHSSCEM
jgi:hypothetical protein